MNLENPYGGTFQLMPARYAIRNGVSDKPYL